MELNMKKKNENNLSPNNKIFLHPHVKGDMRAMPSYKKKNDENDFRFK